MDPSRWTLLVALLALSAMPPGAVLAADGEGEPDHHAEERHAMVEKQLRPRGIHDARVLEAMASVPRHEFVPKFLRLFAYRDRALPIGHGQTISQPYIVAFMTQALDPRPGDTVLEVGTGSGYQAAVLARLVDRVYTVEIVEPLARRARDTLNDLKVGNVEVRAGDGYEGWPEHAPFDAIIVTCSPSRIPPPLVEQLRDGGRMIIPVGEEGTQELVLLEKHGGQVSQRAVLPVKFVPMTGKAKER